MKILQIMPAPRDAVLLYRSPHEPGYFTEPAAGLALCQKGNATLVKPLEVSWADDAGTVELAEDNPDFVGVFWSDSVQSPGLEEARRLLVEDFQNKHQKGP